MALCLSVCMSVCLSVCLSQVGVPTQSAVFLLFARLCTLGFRSPFLLVLFSLSGDIELNSGTANFTISTFNMVGGVAQW